MDFEIASEASKHPYEMTLVFSKGSRVWEACNPRHYSKLVSPSWVLLFLFLRSRPRVWNPFLSCGKLGLLLTTDAEGAASVFFLPWQQRPHHWDPLLGLWFPKGEQRMKNHMDTVVGSREASSDHACLGRQSGDNSVITVAWLVWCSGMTSSIPSC